jgi:hypothetical protein
VNTTMEVITTPRKKKQATKKKLTPKKANNWCCQEFQYSMLLYDAVRKLWTCIHFCVFCVCISGQVLHGWSYVCWIEPNLCVLDLCVLKLYVGLNLFIYAVGFVKIYYLEVKGQRQGR